MTTRLFLKHSAILFLGSNATNFLNFLFAILLGRLLGGEALGEMMAVLGLISFFTFAATPISLAMARFTARLTALAAESELSVLVYYFSRRLLAMGGVLVLVFLFFLPFFQRYLNLADLLLLVWSSPLILVAFWVSFARGFLQGRRRFLLLSISTLSEALSKFLLGTLLILLWFSFLGAMVGIVFANVLAALFLLRWLTKEWRKERGKPFSYSRAFLEFAPVFFSTLFFTVFSSLDVVLAKHYLPSAEAGLYAAYASLGKVLWWLSASVAGVLLPTVTGLRVGGQRTRRFLFLSLGCVILLGLPLLLFYLVWPKILLTLSFGVAFAAGSGLLWQFGVFGLLLGLVGVFVQYFLASGRVYFLFFLFLGVLWEFSLFAGRSTMSISDFIGTINLAMASVLALLVLYLPLVHFLRLRQEKAG